MHRGFAFIVFVSLAGCIAPTPTAPAVNDRNRPQTAPQSVMLTAAEAQRRVKLQEKAAVLEHSLSADPAFSGLKVIQDFQNFRVLVMFKGRKPAASELTNDPELQSVLDVRQSSKSKDELIALQNRIAAVASARKIETMIFTKAETGKVEVHVRDVEAFRAALADLNINDDDVTLIKADDFPRAQRQ